MPSAYSNVALPVPTAPVTTWKLAGIWMTPCVNVCCAGVLEAGAYAFDATSRIDWPGVIWVSSVGAGGFFPLIRRLSRR